MVGVFAIHAPMALDISDGEILGGDSGFWGTRSNWGKYSGTTTSMARNFGWLCASRNALRVGSKASTQSAEPVDA